MADLIYGATSYDRTRGNFPVFPVINMFLEESPTESQPVLVSRPGLANSFFPTLGTGSSPVKSGGMFMIDGVLSTLLYVITGDNKLYKGLPDVSTLTNVGTINGSGHVSWAAYSNLIFVNSGQSVYQYDGATLSTVAMPGGFDVSAICVGASRLVVIDKDTGKFYFSDPLTSTVDALSFATAENSPDKLVDCLYVGDTLVLFGSETVELWPITEDPDTPFQPLVGRPFTKGCRATGCTSHFDGKFAWITNHNNICIQDVDTVISPPWLEEKLALSATASLWNFFLEGQEFLAINLDTNRYVYSAKSKQWSEFNTDATAGWTANSYAGGYFGSGYAGVILKWKDESNSAGPYTDAGGNTNLFERRFRLGVPITTGPLKIDNVFLRVNKGHTPAYSFGRPIEWQDPEISLRTSMDGGQTWGSWLTTSFGVHGDYRQPPLWRSLGTFGFPGFMAEVKLTDRVPFRLSGAQYNEPYPTR